MKKLALFLTVFFLSAVLVTSAHGGVIKWFRIGKFQEKVVDSGDQGEASGEGTFAYYYFDGFTRAYTDHRGWQLGTKDWEDEYGNYVPYKISGAGHGTADEAHNTMPLPDAEEITIRKYMNRTPPTITVDGSRIDEPFPLTEGDEVNPDAIPGTADQMVESWIRTSMGLTIHQRVLGWSQTHHDDYLIYDWTFINTGNIDLDDVVELPNQTLNDVYFIRAINHYPGGYGTPWLSAYGEHPEDTLRISYAYRSWYDSGYDNFGYPASETGFLQRPQWIGEAVLHCDNSPTNHSDDPSQPQMTGAETAELLFIKNEAGITSPADHALLYQTMELGLNPYDGTAYMTGTYPGTHHTLRMDEQGYKYPLDIPWWVWLPCSYYSCGPFTLAPGDSFRIVWTTVVGSITPETAWKEGKAWKDGTCEWDGPDNLPPPAQDYPELVPTYNDWAKDCWVATGKDSLFKNAWAAQWAVQNDYNVPTPPPAPSIEIKSEPDRILVEWGDESEEASDFAGYKVYRAVGSPDYSEEGGVVVGKWESIFECEGTATHSYEDETADRGIANYYYVAAFDDGSENNGLHPGESLESGRYLNMTTRAAYCTREAKELSTVRVVPNPYNINAEELQYPGEPDKIMFLDLPPVCTIKIYSESGDLVQTIEHTSGSGDEAWIFSTTTTGQIVVSGLYIAHIVTLTGESTNVKFFIVR